MRRTNEVSVRKPGRDTASVVRSASHTHGPASAYQNPAGTQCTLLTTLSLTAPITIHANAAATPSQTTTRARSNRPISENWKPAPAAAAIGMQAPATRNSACASGRDVIDGDSVIVIA